VSGTECVSSHHGTPLSASEVTAALRTGSRQRSAWDLILLPAGKSRLAAVQRHCSTAAVTCNTPGPGAFNPPPPQNPTHPIMILLHESYLLRSSIFRTIRCQGVATVLTG
jgi:hypothetical protein